MLRDLEVLAGIQGSVDVLGRHGHLGSLLSVWVAAWGNRLVVRYLASRDVHELVPSLRPGTQGSLWRPRTHEVSPTKDAERRNKGSIRVGKTTRVRQAR